ncbi:hypothetical protein SHIRM173S_06790 [Streptomyces hirsutus]
MLNSLLAATTVTGPGGRTVPVLPADVLLAALTAPTSVASGATDSLTGGSGRGPRFRACGSTVCAPRRRTGGPPRRVRRRGRVGLRAVAGDHPGFEEPEPFEETGDGAGGPLGQPRDAVLVPEGHRRVDVGHVRPGDGVRQHEVTARRQGIHQTPHDPGGLLVVLDEHDDSQQDQCHGTAEFEQFPGLRQDRVGVAQVLVEAGRTALGRTGQQSRRTGQDDRIVVDGDDTGLGGEPLGDLVRVVGGGQPGADVEGIRRMPHSVTGYRTARWKNCRSARAYAPMPGWSLRISSPTS